ncbi:MAG TPA: hypothetical protein GX497_05695 [Bacillus bacterium]|nr:hypothetical protein [Bacillus sp. (in: firmicutes)]
MPYQPLGINLNREYRNSLNAQLKELYDRLASIIPEAGDSNIEIVDARMGVDGTSRTTLGDFIRELQQEIIDLQAGGGGGSQEQIDDLALRVTTVENDIATHEVVAASKTKLGHVKEGRGISINSSGTIDVNLGSGLGFDANGKIAVTECAGGGIPSGLISMWSGAISSIPTGWALCNGSNGTPDLRDRFIVGAGSTYAVGATGGASTIALTAAQLPAHTHDKGTLTVASDGAHTHAPGTLTTSSSGAHTHTVTLDIVYQTEVGRGDYSAAFPAGNKNFTTSSSGAHTHTISGATASGGAHAHAITGATASVGSGQSHENRPPYYALAYIMKL